MPDAKPYVVFARRFRPQTFADVAGQSAVTGALRQALSSGRVAQAYMLCGPRGVGKTSLARIFAKALNCLRGTGPNGSAEEPCNECDACVSIQRGNSLDVIEMDAATNRGIEEVRSLRESVGIAPAQLRCKVYIIDEVHMLTKEAWNAFLKTLEEPPAHVKFVFATTDPNDVPETILSRCQRFDLKRISLADIIKRLRKICDVDKIAYEESALSRIAGLAKGGLRDAEGLLDQAVNLGGGNVTDAIIRELSGAAPDETVFEILQACAVGNAASALNLVHGALETGADPDDLLAVMSERLRCAVLARVCGVDSPLLEGQTHLKESYAALGKVLNEDQCLLLIQLFTQARRQMRDSSQTRLPLEVALIRAARAKDLVDLGKLASVLEATAGKAAPAAPGTTQSRPPGAAPGYGTGHGPGETARPNSQGRPAPDNSRPAAAPRTSTSPHSAPIASGATTTPAAVTAPTATPTAPGGWQRVIELIKAQSGSAMLLSALSRSQLNVDDKAGEFSAATDSDFYRNVLGDSQNQLALKNALAKVYGRQFNLTVRGQSSAMPAIPPARPAPLPLRPASASPVTPPSTEAQSSPLSDDYIDEDALPLNSAAPSAEDDAAPNFSEDDDAPPPEVRVTPPPIAVPRTPSPRAAIDTKLVAEHPLVKLLLKESSGLVIDVDVLRQRKE